MNPPTTAEKLKSKWGSMQIRSSPRFKDSCTQDSSEITPVAHPSTAAHRTKSKRGENDKVCKRILLELHVCLLRDTSFLG
jgi:hypothetical protein